MVLSCCSKWHDMHTNKIEIISQTTKNKMEEAIRKMAESSLRTLCLAYKKVSPNCDLESKDEKGVFNI
jgi:magnesium-transporting ATPase (P-type)